MREKGIIESTGYQAQITASQLFFLNEPKFLLKGSQEMPHLYKLAVKILSDIQILLLIHDVRGYIKRRVVFSCYELKGFSPIQFTWYFV